MLCLQHLGEVLQNLPVDKMAKVNKYNGRRPALCSREDCTKRGTFEIKAVEE